MNLATLSSKGEKNIMENMNVLNCFATNFKLENNILSVKVYIKVRQKDYVVDINNKVVRGNKHTVNEMEYLLTFVKKNSDEEVKCPACGNIIKGTVSEECPFCRNKLIVNPQDFVMSKKTVISQRRL